MASQGQLKLQERLNAVEGKVFVLTQMVQNLKEQLELQNERSNGHRAEPSDPADVAGHNKDENGANTEHHAVAGTDARKKGVEQGKAPQRRHKQNK